MDHNALSGLITLGLIFACYMLPTLVASARKKKNTLAIGALNFCLGWTLLGWVVALVWALTHEEPPARGVAG